MAKVGVGGRQVLENNRVSRLPAPPVVGNAKSLSIVENASVVSGSANRNVKVSLPKPPVVA